MSQSKLASMSPGITWVPPLLDLQLRLGEGTGAVLAMYLVESAARIYNEMATFGEAGAANREGSS